MRREVEEVKTESKTLRLQGGFTLVELVVVIAILGILAGIAIPRFLDSQASAKGAKIVADLRTIDSAATIYYAQHGAYPAAITGNNPDTADGFVGKYLAAWPVPDTGTFIVSLLKGGSKTYTGITDDYYTLSTAGRGLYAGHPVEWYLGGGNWTSETLHNFASTRAAAIKELKEASSNKSYYSGTGLNDTMTKMSGGGAAVKVEASLLAEVFGSSAANTELRWFTNKSSTEDGTTTYYFANDMGSGDHGNWQGYLMVYNGTLYKSAALKSTERHGVLVSGTTTAEIEQSIKNQGFVSTGIQVNM